MASMKFALLSLLAGAAVARPQESQHNVHSKFHTGSVYPSGSGYPFRSKSVGTAPFPANNGTLGGPTASTGGTAPVTVVSTISVVPTPVSDGGSAVAASDSAYGAGSYAGASGSSADAGQTCGPATVTVTSANTVTVTVTPAGGAGAGSIAPVSSSAPYVPPVSSAPFPASNSSSLVGTGTGTAVSSTRVKSTHTKSVVSSSPLSSSAAYVAPDSVLTSSSSAVASVASPVVSPTDTNKPVVAAAQKNAVNQQQSSTAVSSAPAASSSVAVKSTTGPAKGVIYPQGMESRAASIAPAWACNWANAPKTQLSSKTEFVPQLWGHAKGNDNFPDEIKAASAGAASVLFYNEPNLCTDGGSCVDVQVAIPDWTQYMKPLQQDGKKVSSPCVTNNQVGNGGYLDTFLKAFPNGSMDILCFHWYGSCLEGSSGCLKETVKAATDLQKKYVIKEIWLSEMGDTGMIADISHYTSYLDSGVVNRYAYNLANLPAGASM